MVQQLKFFQTSFNRDEAKKAGVIVPSPGVDANYDTAISHIKATEHELQEYLTRQRKKLGCKVHVCRHAIIQATIAGTVFVIKNGYPRVSSRC